MVLPVVDSEMVSRFLQRLVFGLITLPAGQVFRVVGFGSFTLVVCPELDFFLDFRPVLVLRSCDVLFLSVTEESRLLDASWLEGLGPETVEELEEVEDELETEEDA